LVIAMFRYPFRSLTFSIALKGQAGFSLVEMIAVLVLIGIMGAGAGFGISNIVNGFFLSRDAAATASKGQLALLRLSREFRVIKSVSSGSATSIQFKAKHGNADVEDKTYTVTKSGSTITMNDGTTTDILADQVNSLALVYYSTYNGAYQTSWGTDSRIIQLTLIMNGPNNSTQSFATRVTPRNL
jgi:prepilin-type N-terminal cleavage/methylation domain-containing protein